MASAQCSVGDIVSLKLRGPAVGFLKVNRIPMPAGVVIKWSDGRRDDLRLVRLAGGAARDVLASPDAPIVLKVQREGWHRLENLLG